MDYSEWFVVFFRGLEVVLCDLYELISFYFSVFGKVDEIHEVVELSVCEFLGTVEGVVEILCELSELGDGEVFFALFVAVEVHEFSNFCVHVEGVYLLVIGHNLVCELIM